VLPLLNAGGAAARRADSTDVSRAAVQEAKIVADKDIPHLSSALIDKYVTDLQLLGLL
jgi:thioester reductase-like protein